MRRVFEYARSVGLPVFSAGQDAWLSQGTVMNEGSASIRLGMSAAPAEGEATAIYWDGLIAHLAETSVHFQRVSTAAGVKVLRRLLEDGISVTVGTTPHHLCFTEDDVATFDTNTRVDHRFALRRMLQRFDKRYRRHHYDCLHRSHATDEYREVCGIRVC